MRVDDASGKSEEGGSQRVVHHGVERIAQGIRAPRAVTGFVRGIFPDFADDGGIGIATLNGDSDALEHVVGHLVGHVEPIARNADVHPFLQDARFAVGTGWHLTQDIALPRGVALIHFGQGGIAPPAAIQGSWSVWMLEVVPIAIRRIPALHGARLLVGFQRVEVFAVGAGVRKHGVQNHADAPGFRLADEIRKVFVAAQQRIDVLIVGGVVAMVRPRFENGVQIQDLNAERCQIRELFADAIEGSAEEVHRVVLLAAFPVHRFVPVLVKDYGAPHLAVVIEAFLADASASAGKPFGENLVHHRAREPIGRREAWVVERNLETGLRLQRHVVIRRARARIVRRGYPAGISEIAVEVRFDKPACCGVTVIAGDVVGHAAIC